MHQTLNHLCEARIEHTVDSEYEVYINNELMFTIWDDSPNNKKCYEVLNKLAEIFQEYGI